MPATKLLDRGQIVVGSTEEVLWEFLEEELNKSADHDFLVSQYAVVHCLPEETWKEEIISKRKRIPSASLALDFITEKLPRAQQRLVPIADDRTHASRLESRLPNIVGFIDQEIFPTTQEEEASYPYNHKRTVLIHCSLGFSASAAIALAYLSTFGSSFGNDYPSALLNAAHHFAERRDALSINDEFVRVVTAFHLNYSKRGKDVEITTERFQQQQQQHQQQDESDHHSSPTSSAPPDTSTVLAVKKLVQKMDPMREQWNDRVQLKAQALIKWFKDGGRRQKKFVSSLARARKNSDEVIPDYNQPFGCRLPTLKGFKVCKHFRFCTAYRDPRGEPTKKLLCCSCEWQKHHCAGCIARVKNREELRLTIDLSMQWEYHHGIRSVNRHIIHLEVQFIVRKAFEKTVPAEVVNKIMQWIPGRISADENRRGVGRPFYPSYDSEPGYHSLFVDFRIGHRFLHSGEDDDTEGEGTRLEELKYLHSS